MYYNSIIDFTKSTFSSDPVPGGGGVSSLVGSLAVSLSGMVTSLTTGKKKYAEYENEIQSLMKECDELRIKFLNGINEDAEAFKPLAKAYSMPKDSEGYEDKLEECLKLSASSPFNILKLCTRVIEIDERLATIGSKISVSDAATSVMLAYGALYGSLINIKVNTRLMKDKSYAEKLDKEALEITEEYSKRALECYKNITERLTNG